MRSPFYVYPYNSKKNGTYYFYKAWDGDILRGDWPTPAKSKNEAIIYCAELKARGELIPKTHTKKEVVKQQTFNDYAESFWDYDNSKYIQGLLRRGKSYTRTSVENNFGLFRNHIKPFFGDRRMNSITSIELEEWLIQLSMGSDNKKALSGKSCNNILNNIKIMFKMAKKWGLILDNPAESIDPLEKRQQNRGILTPKEVKVLFDPSSEKTIWMNRPIEYIANFLSCTTGMPWCILIHPDLKSS